MECKLFYFNLSYKLAATPIDDSKGTWGKGGRGMASFSILKEETGMWVHFFRRKGLEVREGPIRSFTWDKVCEILRLFYILILLLP